MKSQNSSSWIDASSWMMIRYPAFVIYVDNVYSHRIQFIFWKLHANIDGGVYEFLNSDGQQYPQNNHLSPQLI